MNILLTGGGAGIGRAIALALKKNHHITVLDQKPSGERDAITLDLSKTEEIERFTFTHQKEVDALINVAGIREIIPPHSLERETWEKTFAVNVTAPFLLSQFAIQKALKKKKPLSIINMSSVSGLLAEPDRAAYVSSKHALIGLTKQLAYQYGHEGIRVNAIAPGIIETGMTKPYFENAATVSNLRQNIAVGFWGQCDHIIPLINLCLENTYLNGSILVCDGGWSCGKSL